MVLIVFERNEKIDDEKEKKRDAIVRKVESLKS